MFKLNPNSYDLALRNLERQGFETFLPKKNESNNKKENKFIYKNVLVFPGYIFVGVDQQSSDWTKINSTYGVSKLISFNYKPSEIPPDLILALKNRYENNLNSIINENLNSGDTIKFNNGPFADLVANIESIDAKKRIYVLLEVMGVVSEVRNKSKRKDKFY